MTWFLLHKHKTLFEGFCPDKPYESMSYPAVLTDASLLVAAAHIRGTSMSKHSLGHLLSNDRHVYTHLTSGPCKDESDEHVRCLDSCQQQWQAHLDSKDKGWCGQAPFQGSALSCSQVYQGCLLSSSHATGAGVSQQAAEQQVPLMLFSTNLQGSCTSYVYVPHSHDNRPSRKH